MSDSHQYEIGIVRSRSVLESMAGEWDALAESMGMPMLSHAWVLACAESFYQEDELCIITVRLHGRLAGVAPLVTNTQFCVGRLELIGVSFLCEPSGFLYRDEEALACLTRVIVNHEKPVVLARVPSDSPVIPQLRSIVSGRGMVMEGRVGYSLTVPILSGWEEYVERLSPRRRYDLRRARRRAEESGTVEVRILSPGPDDIEQGIREFVRIESAGWKGRNGSSLRQRDNLRQFFLRYAVLASKTGMFRFAFLDVDEKPIAAQLSVVFGSRFWVFKIGYDEAWSRCSPGWQLLAETMKYAFERKLKSYEFLGSDEPWLHGWVAERRGHRTIGWYSATLRGFYGLAVDTAMRVHAHAASRLQ